MKSDRSRLLDLVGGVEDVLVEEGACVVEVTPLPDACLRIVDVRGVMARTCAKQWHAHGDGSCKWGNQGNRVRMRY